MDDARAALESAIANPIGSRQGYYEYKKKTCGGLRLSPMLGSTYLLKSVSTYLPLA
jgi:hypothetical protein